MLIYLEAPIQKRVISLLHFKLREGGVLFLGNAENISGNEVLFRVLSKKWRIFRRFGPTRHDIVEFPIPGSARQTAQAAESHAPARSRYKAIKQAQRLMMDEFAPPSVLINEQYRVLCYHGDTEPYLRQPPGEPTSDLLTLVREGLRSTLRSGVQAVLHEGKRIRVSTRIRRQNSYALVEMAIIPVHIQPDQEARLLVSFSDAPDRAVSIRHIPLTVCKE